MFHAGRVYPCLKKRIGRYCLQILFNRVYDFATPTGTHHIHRPPPALGPFSPFTKRLKHLITEGKSMKKLLALYFFGRSDRCFSVGLNRIASMFDRRGRRSLWY